MCPKVKSERMCAKIARRRTKRFLWAIPLLFAIAPCEGWAGSLAAIVEDVGASVKGAEFMDYLESGQTLNLGTAGWIEIGYFGSCVHERITGGFVRIGIERSEASGGHLERRQVKCDKDNILAEDRQMTRAAGSAERAAAPPKTSILITDDAKLLLHGAAPLIVARQGGEVVISRLADRSDRLTVMLNKRGAYDFAQFGHSLRPGAVYKATLRQREVVFRIDTEAQAGRTDILGRLILFARENR